MSEQEVNALAVMIGKNIERLLDEHNEKQYELAKVLEVHETTVGKWIAGKTIPRMGHVQEMADHFGVEKSLILNEYTPESALSHKRLVLMDKIKNASDKQLDKYEKLMGIIDDEDEKT